MKKVLKNSLTMILVIAMLCGLCPVKPSFAAANRKCYTISSGNTTVYSNTGLTKKYGLIYSSDEIIVIEVTSKYTKVSYKTSRGTKTGYIKTSVILLATSGKTYKASAKITTCTRPGGSSYGYISKGDQVMVLGTSGNYTQVKYPVSGGYKYAFVTKANADKYIINNSSNKQPSTGTTKLSYGLYKNNTARITCFFDGYRTTKGRHEGIDLCCYNGAAVYSLTDGVVTNVVYGRSGSGGLSTIAIYDGSKTVIYLHTNPVSLRIGQNISKGQKIATQGWRGVSSSSSGHCHVEVREGKRTLAAKSLNDYKLENTNPTAYWNHKGYTIQ